MTKNQVQQVVTSIIYYAQAVNIALLVTLSKATEFTMETDEQLLEYCMQNLGIQNPT